MTLGIRIQMEKKPTEIQFPMQMVPTQLRNDVSLIEVGF